jgi:hypothetical protein
VDKLQEAFKGRSVVLIRDRNEVHYRQSIGDFMRRIGRGKCIVVVLSKGYLESRNCMFELIEIFQRGDIRERIFPIILDDAHIYDALNRIQYIKHWEKKIRQLKTAMRAVGEEYLGGIREEIDLFVTIRNTIAKLVEILADMNSLTPEKHRGSNFDSLFRELEDQLSK